MPGVGASLAHSFVHADPADMTGEGHHDAMSCLVGHVVRPHPRRRRHAAGTKARRHAAHSDDVAGPSRTDPCRGEPEMSNTSRVTMAAELKVVKLSAHRWTSPWDSACHAASLVARLADWIYGRPARTCKVRCGEANAGT